MARRSDWSASGGGLSSRGPPPPSHYGGHPFESYAPPPHGRHPNEPPYGAPPPSYGGPPPSYGVPPASYAGRPPSYGHSSSSFQPPPHGSYESSYYDGPPTGPPPRSPGAPRSWGGPPPPSSASSYGAPPAYEGSPYSSGPSYPPMGGSPSAPRPSSYSHRGGRGGPTGARFYRTPNGAPASEDSKSANSSPGRRLPIHRQHLKPTPSGPAPWQPPSSRKAERPESFEEAEGEDPEKKDGDPLALLAKVSSDMETKPGSKKGNSMDAPTSPATPKTNPSSMAPPTSPLARRHHAPEENPAHRASPVITPNPSVHTQASWKRPRAADDYSATSSRRSLASGPKPITPMPPHYMASGAYDERGPPPPHHTPYGPPPPHHTPYGPPPTGYSYNTQGGPPPHHGGGYGPPPPGYEGGPPPGPPPYGHYAYPHVVERHSFDSQESGSLTSQESWRRGPYGPPPPHGGMEGWYPPPTTPYPGREGGPPGPPYVSPYSHIPQPAVEEKTVLRKKFSWKHYPEVGLCYRGHCCMWVRPLSSLFSHRSAPSHFTVTA
jgi:hypothetical protein